MLPVGDNAEALEALHLNTDVLLGVGLAGGAEVGDAHRLVVELLLLDDGALDGHTVVVPAGDVGGVVATHRIASGDKVLDGLIKCVSHVDVAVTERRSVVQVKQGLALVFLEHFVVDVKLLPVGEHLRLTLGQTRSHGKIGLGKIQCVIVLLCHSCKLHSFRCCRFVGCGIIGYKRKKACFGGTPFRREEQPAQLSFENMNT